MTVKSAIMFGGCLLSALFVYPKLIIFLKKIRYSQTISEYSLADYKQKEGTPTMGGLAFIFLPIIFIVFIYPSFYQDATMMLVIMVYLGYGLIGFIDDYIIVIKHDNAGLKASYKFLMQLALSIVFYLIYREYSVTTINIWFLNWSFDLGWVYALLVFFMFTGTSNAVNITDGMDGLAAGTTILALIPFVVFAFIASKPYIAVFVIGVIGALLGYLRYNLHPAKVFMGDVGSLALGGLLAGLALVLKQELSLIIVGGVFVYETLCVIIQITSVKLFKKKVFRYTPIHYSFVIQGMSEIKVVRMFWILGFLFMIFGLLIGVNV
ncbi:MAG: phospho-N-acetylmuramoyl-pentapeptide-transferase [Erysipelotrichaceae bacterium]|nr:phospho-N-acetylmuramoyl-pentapeptide-transferase [Erysipelotrichaceae bacterium]